MATVTPQRQPGALVEANYATPLGEEEEQMLEEEEYAIMVEGGHPGIKVVGSNVSLQAPHTVAAMPPRAVHQCNICNKIFVSFKGLQQHAVIHTDQKPFSCDICAKSFRFKSNLFEHRTVHSGFTPHACPYCGKTCRLKGNLKKHLKTHVSSKEELDEAWKPFARFSNRRPPADIPDDAIIVRSAGEPYFTPPSKPRRKKLGLGADSKHWVEKIRRGEVMPTGSVGEKLHRLYDILKSAEENYYTLEECVEQAKAIPLERYDCPVCKSVFMSRLECLEHTDLEHPMARMERTFFCEVCLKTFLDRKTFEQHESYHKRVQLLLESGELTLIEPGIVEADEDLIYLSQTVAEEDVEIVETEEPQVDV